MKNISLKLSLIVFFFLSACSDPIYKMHPKNNLLNSNSEKEIDLKLSPIHKVMYDLSIKLATISKSLLSKGRPKPSLKNPKGLNQIVSTEKEIKVEKEVSSYDEKIQEELHALFLRIQKLDLSLKKKFLVELYEKEALNNIRNHFFRLKAFFDEKIPINKLKEKIKELEKEMKELSSKIKLLENRLNN